MNDQLNWENLKNGDKSALEQIYRAYATQLFRYGHAFTKDESLVEDCVQDLFIILWEKRKTLGPTTSVKNYLFASLRRNLWKKLKKRQTNVEVNDAIEMKFHLEPNIEDRKINAEQTKENSALLQSALAKLSARQKEVVYLKYHEGLSYEDICQTMDLNYQSARNLLSGALRIMRKLMIASILYFWLLNNYSGF